MAESVIAMSKGCKENLILFVLVKYYIKLFSFTEVNNYCMF